MRRAKDGRGGIRSVPKGMGCFQRNAATQTQSHAKAIQGKKPRAVGEFGLPCASTGGAEGLCVMARLYHSGREASPLKARRSPGLKPIRSSRTPRQGRRKGCVGARKTERRAGNNSSMRRGKTSAPGRKNSCERSGKLPCFDEGNSACKTRKLPPLGSVPLRRYPSGTMSGMPEG